MLMKTFFYQQTERQGPVGGATSPEQEKETNVKPAKRYGFNVYITFTLYKII